MRNLTSFILAAALTAGLSSCTRSGSTSGTTNSNNGAGATSVTTVTMVTARADHEAVELPSGSILFLGGQNNAGALSSVEAFVGLLPSSNPSTQLIGSLLQARFNFGAVLLGNGLVFVCGGNDGNGNALVTTELFNPATGISTAGPNLSSGRYGHVTFGYVDGGGQEKVAICGGINTLGGGQTALLDFEIYDPGANTITTGGNMADYAFFSEPITGGALGIGSGFRVDANGNVLTHGLQTFDPNSGTFTAQSWIGTGATERGSAGVAATSSGDIYLIGGTNANQTQYSKEIFSFSGTVTLLTEELPAQRSQLTSTVLSNDDIALIGGFDGSKARNDVDLFDGSTVTRAQRLQTARYGHTATVLQSGDVLVAGGNTGFRYIANCEVVDTAAPPTSGGGGGGGGFTGWDEDFETVPPTNAQNWTGATQDYEFGPPGTSGPAAVASSGTNIAGTGLNADYSDAAQEQYSLELINIDLSTASGTLTFTGELWYDIGTDDYGLIFVYDTAFTFVDAMPINGTSQFQYNTIVPFNGFDGFDNTSLSSQWLNVEGDLSAYVGIPDLFVSFDLVTDGTNTAGAGIFVDNCEIN